MKVILILYHEDKYKHKAAYSFYYWFKCSSL